MSEYDQLGIQQCHSTRAYVKGDDIYSDSTRPSAEEFIELLGVQQPATV